MRAAMREDPVGMVDAANNASATVRGVAATLVAFAAPTSDEINGDVITLLYNALHGAADAMEGVAESIRRDYKGEEQ